MTLFVALLLTVLTFAIVTLPFFRKRLRPISAVTDEESQELFFKRDTTYAMLKELEFDYQSGVLTEEDYHDLEDRYKRKGISILKNIDSLPEDSKIDALIEKQVSRLRQRKSVNVSDEIEDKISSLRQSKGRFCPQCGTKHQPDARFCGQCGVKLSTKGKRD